VRDHFSATNLSSRGRTTKRQRAAAAVKFASMPWKAAMAELAVLAGRYRDRFSWFVRTNNILYIIQLFMHVI
jgi:hypothetical protein